MNKRHRFIRYRAPAPYDNAAAEPGNA